MKSRWMFTAVGAALLSFAVQAQPPVDALSKCLGDNTTGKDRKDLARWLFVGMAAHPEMASIATLGSGSVEAAQRSAGAITTRLIADACPTEVRSVMQSNGSTGLTLAFEFLGRLAMQELMANPQVNSTISGFEKHMDRAKIENALR